MTTATRTLLLLLVCLVVVPAPASAAAEPVENLLPQTGRPIEKRSLGEEDRQRYQPFGYGVGGAAISPDGKLLLTGTGMQGIVWWDLQTGRALDRTNYLSHGEGLTAAFTPDGKQVVTNGYGGHTQGHPVTLWDAVKRQRLRGLDDDVNDIPFTAAAVAPDGKTIAFGGSGGRRAANLNIVLWDLASGDEIGQVEGLINAQQPQQRNPRNQGNTFYQALAYSPDGRTLAVLLEGRVLLIELALRKLRCEMHFTVLPQEPAQNRAPAGAGALAFAPDGRTLAVGCADGAIHRFDLRNGQELPPLPGHTGAISALCWKPDGKQILSYGVDGQLFVWIAQRGQEWQPKPGPLTDEALETLWEVLRSDDALDLFGCVQTLAASPTQTIPFLRKHLSLAPKGDAERITHLLQEVQKGDYNTRKRAVGQLRKIGAAVLPEMQKLQQMGGYDELMNQLANEFANLAPPPGEAQAIRAVRVLERIGNADAVKLLTELSGGAPQAALTLQAKEARDRLAKVEPAKAESTPAALYQTLGGKDPVLAYQAVRALARRPGNASLLRDRLKELATGDVFNDDPARLAKLITELDDEDFAVRDNANKALRNLGVLAAPAMRKALAKTENIEPKQRLEQLITEAGATPSPEVVRVMRVLEALELMGGADARQALEAFHKEAKSPWLVQAARESLVRLREEKR